MFQVGKKYIFMGQRYAYSGTIEQLTPTHALLGADAEVHYEDVGQFSEWAKRKYKQGLPVPGQVVCLLGCDATPIGISV